jgi:hypothetical protein
VQTKAPSHRFVHPELTKGFQRLKLATVMAYPAGNDIASVVDFRVPRPQLRKGDAVARRNGVTGVARPNQVEAITVGGDPRHGGGVAGGRQGGSGGGTG